MADAPHRRAARRTTATTSWLVIPAGLSSDGEPDGLVAHGSGGASRRSASSTIAPWTTAGSTAKESFGVRLRRTWLATSACSSLRCSSSATAADVGERREVDDARCAGPVVHSTPVTVSRPDLVLVVAQPLEGVSDHLAQHLVDPGDPRVAVRAAAL